MKILMDKNLRLAVDCQVNAALASDSDADRNELIAAVLAQFVRGGDAQRYIRRDGRIGWRVSNLMLERLAEEEAEVLLEGDDVF